MLLKYQAHAATLPHIKLQLSTGNLQSHRQADPSLHALLLCWCQEAYLPTVHRSLVFTTAPAHRRPLIPHKRVGAPAPPLSNNLLLSRCQETCFLKLHRGTALSTTHNNRRFPLPHQRARMSSPPLRRGKWQPVTLQEVPGGLPPQSAQRPSASHHAHLQESPLFSVQEQGTPATSLRGRKW
jgi:hypothetical protein